MLDVARASGVKRIVFSSSGGTVYGPPMTTPIPEDHPTNPSCSYGIVKLAIEKYLALYNNLCGLDYIVLRIANPYGERQRLVGGQGAVAAFLGRALRGEAIEIWGDGSVIRDYIYIGDVCDALIAAATCHSVQGVLSIGSGIGMMLKRSCWGYFFTAGQAGEDQLSSPQKL
jgi:UDP-glucose 4-epimerase